jgi:hypothetical protein
MCPAHVLPLTHTMRKALVGIMVEDGRPIALVKQPVTMTGVRPLIYNRTSSAPEGPDLMEPEPTPTILADLSACHAEHPAASPWSPTIAAAIPAASPGSPAVNPGTLSLRRLWSPGDVQDVGGDDEVIEEIERDRSAPVTFVPRGYKDLPYPWSLRG